MSFAPSSKKDNFFYYIKNFILKTKKNIRLLEKVNTYKNLHKKKKY